MGVCFIFISPPLGWVAAGSAPHNLAVANAHGVGGGGSSTVFPSQPGMSSDSLGAAAAGLCRLTREVPHSV